MASTQPAEPVNAPQPARFARLGVLAGYLAMAAVLAGHAVGSGARRYTEVGDSFPGTLTAVAEPVGFFTAALAGALCLGGLVYVALTARPDDTGVIDPGAFRVHAFAEVAAVVWLVAAVVMVPVQAANDSGVSVTRLVASGQISEALSGSEMGRAWIAVAVCAAVVALALRMSVRWVWHVVLAVPSIVGVVALPVTGNAGQGPDHDYATSAVIVFAVVLAVLTGSKAAVAIGRPPSAARRRMLAIGVLCEATALAYGALLLVLLLGSPGLTGSDYGRWSIVAGVLLLALVAVDGWALVRKTGPDGAAAALGGTLGAIVVVGAVAAMAVQTAPRLLEHPFTAWDVFLGYQLPNPPTAVQLATLWRFDVFIGVAALVAAGGYLYGYLRLRRRGDRWPAGRLIAWLSGCLLLVITTGSGVKAYGIGDVQRAHGRAHEPQHVHPGATGAGRTGHPGAAGAFRRPAPDGPPARGNGCCGWCIRR